MDTIPARKILRIVLIDAAIVVYKEREKRKRREIMYTFKWALLGLIGCLSLLMACGCGESQTSKPTTWNDKPIVAAQGGTQSKHETEINCSGLKNYSMTSSIWPSVVSGGSGFSKPESGRFYFPDKKYKDVVLLGNGTRLDIAYQGTDIRVNGKDNVFYYGLQADPSEISQARMFASCYERAWPIFMKDVIELPSEPEPSG